jgi:hypothetical protein
MSIVRGALIGSIAGAAGTVALNGVTYADMVLRGRPSSGVPAEVAERLAAKVGIDLSGDDEVTQSRKSGLGALFGIATGLGVGAAYGLVNPRPDRISSLRAGAALGLAAMAGSDMPATALGVTNPAEWEPDSWVSDIVPHLAYGLVAAATYKALVGVQWRV